MAGPFSFSGWGTNSIAPAPVSAPATAAGTGKGIPSKTPMDAVYDNGVLVTPGGNPAPMAVPTSAPTTLVQTGGSAVAPGSFSFSGWNSSHLVPKTVSAPIVQGQSGSIPANAIPVGTGGPASGGAVGGSGVPGAITDAQNTLGTLSNPSLLGFFQSLLNQNKGGGGGNTLVNSVAPGQAKLNQAKLNSLAEPQNLQNQIAALAKQRADLQTPGFSFYAGSEQERIDNAVRNLQTRLGPAQQSAAGIGLARPSTSYVPAGRAGSGWISPMGGAF